MKVLFLQPKEYFSDLFEINSYFGGCDLVFGYPPFIRLEYLVKKFDVIVSCIDHEKNSRAICLAAKKAGLETIFFQDGIFDFENSINNPYLRANNLSLHEIDCYTKIYFSDHTARTFFNNRNSTYETYWPLRMLSREVASFTPKSQNNKVLISTANNPIFDESELDRLVDLIVALKASLEKLGIEYHYRIFDDVLIKRLNISPLQNMLADTFEDCLLAGYCALFTTPSSIVNTAAAVGIPVAIFDYRSSPLMSVAGWRLHLSVDFETEIISLMEQTPARMEYQARMLPSIPTKASTSFQIKNQRTDFTYVARLVYRRYLKKLINLKALLIKLKS